MRKTIVITLAALAIAMGTFLTVKVSVSGPRAALADPPASNPQPAQVAQEPKAPKPDNIVQPGGPEAPTPPAAAPQPKSTTPKADSNPTPGDEPTSCKEDKDCSNVGEICLHKECQENPCAKLLCGGEKEADDGCINAAVVHYNGIVEFEKMREHAYTLSHKPNSEERFKKANKAIRASLMANYWASFSYLPASTKNELKKLSEKDFCELFTKSGTRRDTVHNKMGDRILNYRFTKSTQTSDADEQPAEEAQTEEKK